MIKIKQNSFNTFQKQLDISIRARIPLLYIVSYEEERAIKEIQQVTDSEEKKLYIWSLTEGLCNIALPNEKMPAATKDPYLLMKHIIDSKEKAIYIFLDLHYLLDKDPRIVRRLRDAEHKLLNSNKTIIILSPILTVPEELEKSIKVLDYDLPSIDELNNVLNRLKSKLVKLSSNEREQLVQAARGLTIREMENVLSEALVSEGKITKDTIHIILEEKKQIIRKSGVLEYFAPDSDLTDVGGLASLKLWLTKRKRAFSEDARKFGIPAPKGVLLVGVQGCGKSLVAKSIAALWRLPLLRLDMGRLFSGLVGSSEANLRKATRLAEMLSPAILWIDEIEKGLSGIQSSGYSDGGTTARVYGSFITWLQEKKTPVFVVATANMIKLLPPEILRKGRLDEIFFVDLPRLKERKEIFRIHLQKRHRQAKDFDLKKLANSSEGFSGAEIEQAIIDGLYDAFENGRPLTSDDIEHNLKATVPISKTMEENISELRLWAQTRTRRAS